MVHAIVLAVAHISYLDTTWESQGFYNHMQFLVLFQEQSQI